eukprot:COSAG01_NODE_1669_length_9561_cov_12.004122_3_plen_208_part_00
MTGIALPYSISNSELHAHRHYQHYRRHHGSRVGISTRRLRLPCAPPSRICDWMLRIPFSFVRWSRSGCRPVGTGSDRNRVAACGGAGVCGGAEGRPPCCSSVRGVLCAAGRCLLGALPMHRSRGRGARAWVPGGPTGSPAGASGASRPCMLAGACRMPHSQQRRGAASTFAYEDEDQQKLQTVNAQCAGLTKMRRSFQNSIDGGDSM